MFVVSRLRKISLILAIVSLACLILILEGKSKTICRCWRGYCDRLTANCICKDGWFGDQCQFCRQKLTADNGVITDGEGEYMIYSRCMWLIHSSKSNSSIELSLSQFETECSWDILYVYDGPSVRAPLLATFSGILRDNTSRSPVRTLRSTSSTIFLYFFSDENSINSGFRIKYSVKRDCLSKCSHHGNCDALLECICNPGWTGSTCSSRTCAYSCIHGFCNSTTWQCVCSSGYTGPSCNISSGYGSWTQITATNQDAIQGRASHGVGVIGDWLWVFGGYSLIKKPFHNLVRYSFSKNIWKVVRHSNLGDAPGPRYGHSLVVYNNSLIIFGGISHGKTINELWRFDVNARQWTRLSLSKHSSSPLPVSGHTATIVNSKMIILFGYGPVYGFTSHIQEFDLVSKQWQIYNASIKEGTYGHTSVYDPISKLIYVHGGTSGSLGLTEGLYSYDPIKRQWSRLKGNIMTHFLHSAVLIGHLMLVYAGNTKQPHTIQKCFDSEFLAYDIICGQWRKMPSTNLPPLHGSLGQAAVVYNGKMYVFGGFAGVMMNDILSYSLGDCSVWTNNQTACYDSSSSCFWEPSKSHCVNPYKGYTANYTKIYERAKCDVPCGVATNCLSCKGNGQRCKWCDATCKKKSKSCTTAPEACELIAAPPCEACNQAVCETHRSCEECKKSRTGLPKNACMWCEDQQRCVPNGSYLVSFPYGQCGSLVINQPCKDVKCKPQNSCASCHSLPGCGWCDDGSGTGVGHCTEGGNDGPFSAAQTNVIGFRTCPIWSFMKCPACQCNGHSTCNKDGHCLQCINHTAGRNCQLCAVGFYGDSHNGGMCKACQCNGHAITCHHSSGQCDCLMKGVGGTKCDRCEDNYSGNATNGRMCFYKLRYGDEKIFNVSNKTSLNLEFSPLSTDRDLKFVTEVLSGPPARVNVTYFTGSRPLVKEGVVIISNYLLGKLEERFSQRDYAFHKKIIFRVHIYKIDSGATLRIKAYFSQPSTLNIDLLEFFLTFFGCFLSLLFVASIGWRIRSRYHNYLVTRERRAERDRMANRPFATVNLLLPNEFEVLTKSSPSRVAMEPLVKNKVAIATVVVALPDGEDGVTPVGQCGICCASMLMSHGTHSHSGLKSRMGRKKNRKRATMTTYHA